MNLVSIVNEFVVEDMQKSIAFYRENLGFEIELTEEEKEPFSWVQMKCGETRIMLEDYFSVCQEIPKFPSKADSTNLIKFKYNNTHKEIKEFYNTLKEKQVEFFMEIKKTAYGMTEFGILDPDKNRILISS